MFPQRQKFAPRCAFILHVVNIISNRFPNDFDLYERYIDGALYMALYLYERYIDICMNVIYKGIDGAMPD